MRVGQRVKQHGLHNAEDGRVRAYTQSQGEHGNCGEPRAAAERPQAEADILPKGFHRREGGHFTSHLLQQDGIAEWAARR